MRQRRAGLGVSMVGRYMWSRVRGKRVEMGLTAYIACGGRWYDSK